MKSDRWAKVAEIYEAASECAADERGAFLVDACGGDDELRREVESLLAQDVSRDGPIERAAADAASLRPRCCGASRRKRKRWRDSSILYNGDNANLPKTSAKVKQQVQ